MTVNATRITATVATSSSLGGTFTADATLRLQRLRVCLAPELPVAVIERDYGYIVDSAGSAALRTPLDLRNKWVKLTLADGTNTTYWVGLITEQLDQPEGIYAADHPITACRAAPIGRTRYEARSLEWLLSKYRIDSSYIEGKGVFSLARIQHPLVFNSRDKLGRVLGNRSASVDGTTGTYVFSDTINSLWTQPQALEYLCYLFQQLSGIQLPLSIHSMHDDMYVVDVWDVSGMSFHDAFSTIVSPGAGWSWHVANVDYTGVVVPELMVLSISATDIYAGTDLILTGSELSMAVDLDTDTTALGEARPVPAIRRVEDSRYHYVEVRGDPVRVVFSCAYSDNLETNWTAGQKTAYDAETDEAQCSSLDYRHVYQSHKLEAAWDGKADTNYVLRKWDAAAGTLLDSLADNWARAALRLDPTIPILDVNGQERPPLVLAVSPDTGDYFDVAKPHPEELTPSAVHVLEDELGFRVTGPIPHFWGAGTYSGSLDGEACDYRHIVATVSMHTSERVRILKTIAAPPTGCPPRTKVIEVPGAAYVYAVPETVRDFNGASLDTIAAGEVIRDDTDVLRDLANLAAVWYSSERIEVSLRYPQGQVLDYLGYQLASLTYDGTAYTPLTVVSSVEYRFGQDQAVTLQTNWADLDWRLRQSRLSGASTFIGRGPTGDGSLRYQLQQLDDRLRGLPANLPIPPNTAPHRIDFEQSYCGADHAHINIADGHVRLIGADVSSGGVPTCIETAVTGLTDQAISPNIAAFVEITCAPDSNPVVTNTVQTVALASWAKYATDPSGTLYIRHRLGYSTSGVWYREFDGELQAPATLYQPNITETNTTGGSGTEDIANAYQYLCAQGFYTVAIDEDRCESVNGRLQTGGSNFFEGERLGVLVKGGQFIKLYEKSALKFGGTNDDVAVKRPSMPTFPADNQFKFAAFTDTRTIERGLVQANSVAASTSDDVVLTTDGLWIKLDSALKQLQHIHRGSDTTYDWATFYVASTSGGSPDKEVIVDTNGHVRKYNGGTPTQTTKYKCEKCDDPTYIIYRTSDPGAFFEIGGNTCYKRVGSVVSGATVNTDTITNTYASCAECEAARVNHKWKKCLDDSYAATFSPANNPTTDYAWLYLTDPASAPTKCYDASELESTTATDKCAVESNGTAPASCSDVTMAYFSDTFPGTALRCRWVETKTGITTSVAGNVYSAASAGGNDNDDLFTALVPPALTGDFEFTVEVTRSNKTYTAAGSWDATAIYLNVYFGAAVASICIGECPNKTGYYRYFIKSEITGTDQWTENQIYSIKLKVKRVSGTISCWYDAGSGWVKNQEKAGSATVTAVHLATWHDVAESCNFTFANFTASGTI